MPLLNYTSEIPVERTVGEISMLLAKGGARQVMHDYDDDGNIVALSFLLELDGQRIPFKLPTDWRPVRALLQKTKPNGHMKIEVFQSEEHARDVAWRITKDWVEAQLAIIETQMVTTAQVFLPYAITAGGQSMYEYIGSHTNLLLGDGNNGN